MSPEEMQRTMQFVLQQQAQFVADSAASQVWFDEWNKTISGKTDQLATGLIGLTAIVGQVVDSVSHIAEAQMRTTEAQMRTDEQLMRTDEQLKQTDEQLKQTDEQLQRTESHLNVVIQMFERHLREAHGQGPS
jgi:maltodextrin utilization protein YvdJ